MIECNLYVTSLFLDTYVDQSCIDIYDKVGCYITFPLGLATNTCTFIFSWEGVR